MKHRKKKYWVLPPDADARYVYHMEQVLAVYERPYDPLHPVLGMDESPSQLVGETRTKRKKSDGTELIDYEYVRNGVQSIFMAVEPLRGKRFVQSMDDHKTESWVRFIIRVIHHYKHAKKITIILDNLSTHKPEAFYQYFPPEQAKAILDRMEFVFTPPHGSWLNVAEIELSVLIGQCLDRRIADKETLKREIQAWKKARDEREAKIQWNFFIHHARKKLKKIYPDPICLRWENEDIQPEIIDLTRY